MMVPVRRQAAERFSQAAALLPWALLGAERLLVKKTARGGVTAALALNAWEVRFG